MELSAAATTITLILVAWLALALVVALLLGAIVRRRDSEPSPQQTPELWSLTQSETRPTAHL